MLNYRIENLRRQVPRSGRCVGSSRIAKGNARPKPIDL